MVPWFNAECVQPKKEFFKLRKQYKQNKTDAYLRISLLYANIKKKCKYRYMYHVNGNDRISHLSKTNPTGSTLNEIRVHWVNLVLMVQIYILAILLYILKVYRTGPILILYHNMIYMKITLTLVLMNLIVTEEELGKTISTLIRNKSCGIDNIVADFFIDAKTFIVAYLVPILIVF